MKAHKQWEGQPPQLLTLEKNGGRTLREFSHGGEMVPAEQCSLKYAHRNRPHERRQKRFRHPWPNHAGFRSSKIWEMSLFKVD